MKLVGDQPVQTTITSTAPQKAEALPSTVEERNIDRSNRRPAVPLTTTFAPINGRARSHLSTSEQSDDLIAV